MGLLAMLCAPAGAEDNTQIVVSNTSTNAGSVMSVGASGTNNTLLVTNGGVLENQTGYIGRYSQAHYNTAWVQGSGSIWTNKRSLFIGNEGSNNQLIIQNGGVVYANKGFVGQKASSSNNLVTVTGAGSTWQMIKGLTLGRDGSFNRITVAEGAKLFNTTSRIGDRGGSMGNQMQVSGVGSEWTNTTVRVGNSGSQNRLEVINGGTVSARNLYLGTKAASDGNQLFVDGLGSTLVLETDLRIGNNGRTNRMIISNGGKVSNTTGYVGRGSKARDNEVIIRDSGSVWTNRGALHVGFRQDRNTLVVTNGGVVYSQSGNIGFYKSAKENRVSLSGAGSKWVLDKDLRVGREGSKNELILRDQAEVEVGNNFWVGSETNAKSNYVLIDDAGLTVSNRMYIGNSGSKNSMIVTNGGVVIARINYIGGGGSAEENKVIVTGPSSKMIAQSTLQVGRYGSNNQLYIQNSGQVDSLNSSVGYFENSTQNTLQVKGAGSTLKTGNLLRVGFRGSTNRLEVTAGGIASAKTLYIGQQATARNNSVDLQGIDSLLYVTNSIFIGQYGSGNRLVATDGARIESTDVFMGRYAGAENNTVALSNATWQARNFYVGREGNQNRVDVKENSVVEAVNTYLGYSALDNSITVDGSGATWTNYASFFIGYQAASTGNVLRIQNGGSLISGALAVRTGNKIAMNNSASMLITGGSNASLTGGGRLIVGENQGGNLLTVAAGGEVESGESIFGLNTSASANTGSIDGAGSRWNASRFVVGENAGNNTFTVSNGGQLNADTLEIGKGALSENNQVTVTGTDSKIILSGALHVGQGEAVGNVLRLLLNGRIEAQTVTVYNKGRVHLENGVLVALDNTLIPVGGTLSGWGQISGAVTNMGLIDIGNTTYFETLAFGAQLVLSGTSEIIFDLAGLNALDQVEVAQTISFGGKLTVRFANGFSPEAGDAFDLFNWGSGSPGSFSSMDLPALSGGGSLAWDTSALSTTGTLTVVPEPLVASFIGFSGLFFLAIRRIFKGSDVRSSG